MEHDRDLVERSRRGEVAAFSALVDRYRYAVFGLCLGRTQDRDTAEDIAQEVFIKAFLKLRELADPDRFIPWLRRIAINECHDLWRKHPPGQLSLSEIMVEKVAAPASTPEDELISLETRQTVLAALGQLCASQQQVITLFYLEELSLEQIAAFLEVSPNTVYHRLYRARLRLKEVMLGLVEKTFREQKLPDDFADQVVSAALMRGRQLLEQRRWSEAKTEFRRVAEIAAQHREARRGMAQALAGEVQEMFGAERVYDEKVVQEAFVALEEAYRLGARDQDTVWGLASLYQSLSQYEELVQFLEIYLLETGDPEQALKAFRQATYNAAVVLKDYERIFALHRRFVALERVSQAARLESYCLPVTTAYFEVGQAALWLTEAEALVLLLGLPLSRTHCMHYCDTIDLLNRMGEHETALQVGMQFLDRLENEDVEEPIQRRWWMIDIWGPMLQSYRGLHDEDGLTRAREAGEDILHAYDAEWQAALESTGQGPVREELNQYYQRHVGGGFHDFGYYCRQAGLIEEATEYFERAIEIEATALRYLFLAGLKMQQGDRMGSIEALKHLNAQWRSCILTGYARRYFYSNEGFDTVRQDPEFLALVGGGLHSGEEFRC